METVHILCCARNSIYKTLHAVDCWDEARDVRNFTGSGPVVTHAPCRAWSAFCSHQAKVPPGEKELALLCADHLRRNGGVFEHPAHSRAFKAAGLPLPGESLADLWTVEVWQAWWGYSMMKKTWLCFSKIDPANIKIPFREHVVQGDRRRQQVMSKHQRAATCPAFAEWLLAVARTVS